MNIFGQNFEASNHSCEFDIFRFLNAFKLPAPIILLKLEIKFRII